MNKRMIYQRWFLSIILGCGLSLGRYMPVYAVKTNDIPMGLQEFIAKVDDAANSKNLKSVKSFYGDQYITTDGLTLNKLAEGISKLWIEYPNLRYQTKILSWEKIKETRTTQENARIARYSLLEKFCKKRC